MPRHKVKSQPRRGIPNLSPIVPTAEMIDCIIVEHQTQQIYTDCANDHCTKPEGEGVNGRCFECFAYVQAANKLRLLCDVPHWTPSGLPESEAVPQCLTANPRAIAQWKRAWRLRQELIKRAKRRLARRD